MLMSFKIWLEENDEEVLSDDDIFLIMKAFAKKDYFDPSSLIDSRVGIETRPFMYMDPDVYGSDGGLYVGDQNKYHTNMIQSLDDGSLSPDFIMSMYSVYQNISDKTGAVGRIGRGIGIRDNVLTILHQLREYGMDKNKIKFISDNDDLVKTALLSTSVVSIYSKGVRFGGIIAEKLLEQGRVYPNRTYLVYSDSWHDNTTIGKISDRGELMEYRINEGWRGI